MIVSEVRLCPDLNWVPCSRYQIRKLSPHLAMTFGGEPGMLRLKRPSSRCFRSEVTMRVSVWFSGDTNNFADYVERNMRLFQIRWVRIDVTSNPLLLDRVADSYLSFASNDNELPPPAASAWIRRTL